jgi:hypothetical protein
MQPTYREISGSTPGEHGMRLSVLQDKLAKGLSIVSRAVENRPTLPVLGNVLLATEDARLKLAATNLEMSITTWIGAKVEQEGAITLPAKPVTPIPPIMPSRRHERLRPALIDGWCSSSSAWRCSATTTSTTASARWPTC